MLSKISSFGIAGLDAFPITIETDLSPGLPSFTIVGLPDNAIKESRERVRAAIKNCGLNFPMGRITVNLSPADTKKEGPGFDLAVALGILTASQQLNPQLLTPYAFLGELSLDGSILPINGALCVAMAAGQSHCQGLIVPLKNAPEAALIQHPAVYGFLHLKELLGFLNDPSLTKPHAITPMAIAPAAHSKLDFADVKGQAHLKRGLEVAAAGGHNVILIGPPGSGKTMLAKRLSGILPAMSTEEAMEITKIYSVTGLLARPGLMHERPFRSPHHTASDIALIGGGPGPKPGEVTLAHHGILFLDELPEFNRHVLEVLRQPLEEYHVSIARANRSIKFPAKFMLVAALNPCPCGFRLGGKKTCACSPLQIERYMGKISGPLLDRIDIHLEAQALKTKDLFEEHEAETSLRIKQRTAACRQRQLKRFNNTGIYANAQMHEALIKKHCPLGEDAAALLKRAVDNLGLSARAHDKILKVARTISDLEDSENIRPQHIAEAIGYRALDRMK